ncbi:MAG TPA: PQQ-binding-like beta-propeller repeat protein [Terriglobales bacterium]|nr:PQQ-binding-like beta-propeller repeat protein [Terriglobales bacterium]
MKKLSLSILLLSCIPCFSQDAAMFRGNPRHTGLYQSSPLTKPGTVKWKFATHGMVMSSPAVVDGVAYFGSDDHNLYAVNVDTGVLKWKFATKSRVTSSPAVANGMVYFGSFDGNFYGVDAASGQQKWTFRTAGEHRFTAQHLHGLQPATESMPDPFDFYLSSPAVVGNAVYFGSGDGNVYALDASAGTLNWKFHTGDVVHGSPAVADGVVFVGSWDSYFYALDAANGTERWRLKTGEDPDTHNQVGIQSSPVIADGVVYFGCRDSNLYAVNAQTGQKKWAFSNKGSWVIASPVVKNGKVYFATSDSGLFRALDAGTGAELFSLDFKHWPMFSSPAIAGDMLYIGSHTGKLIAVNLKSQAVAWTFETEASKKNGAMFMKNDGTPNYEAVFADDFYDEIVVGMTKMLGVGAILSSPVIVNGVIYFGSTDGNLYALQ